MSSTSITALVSTPSKAANSAIASIEKNVKGVSSQISPATSALAAKTAQTASSFVSQTSKLASNPAQTASSIVSQTSRLTSSLTTPLKTAQSAVQQSLPPPSPGQYRHPRLTEIISRRNASSFSDSNVRNALTNIAALGITLAFGDTIYTSILTIFSLFLPSQISTTTTTILISFLRLLLLANTFFSLKPALPYISKDDTVSDIPLTPSQRSLLGLPPTPQSQSQPQSLTPMGTPSYMTPPRYHRTPGSVASSPSSAIQSTDRRSVSATYSGSPQTTSRHAVAFSPSSQSQSLRRSSTTAFSPAASPLLHKAVKQSSAQSFDQTLNASTSGLSRSQSVREMGLRRRKEGGVPDTPSPGAGAGIKRSPGINYKWMYDKGFGLSKSESMGF